MHIERETAGAIPVVSAFVGTGFRVNTVVYLQGVKLTTEAVIEWLAPALDALVAGDLADLVALKPEFIVLGTGPSLRRPDKAVSAYCEAHGIGLEIMDSRAAARAWGVLMAEGRQIAAAILPLG